MVETGLSKDWKEAKSEIMDTLDVPETETPDGEISDDDEGG